MHPGVEKLDKLFNDAQKNPQLVNEFFEQLWFTGGMLPRPEMRLVVQNMYDWLKPKAVVEQKNFALANLALGFVCYHEGKFDESIRQDVKAQKLFTEIGDLDGAAISSVMLGNCYRSLGEVELALKYLLEGY